MSIPLARSIGIFARHRIVARADRISANLYRTFTESRGRRTPPDTDIPAHLHGLDAPRQALKPVQAVKAIPSPRRTRPDPVRETDTNSMVSGRAAA